MAYSNYGAYVWKEDKDMTEDCCDVGWIWLNNAWIKYDPEKHGDKDHVFAHAVIIYNNIALEFYKTWLKVYRGQKDGSVTCEYVDCENKIWHKPCLTRKGFEIVGYELNDWIQLYEITFGKDKEHWCVIIGNAFGKGYDKYHISKFLKKTRYNPESQCYYTPDKSEYAIGYYTRKDEIRDAWHDIWSWNIKPMFKNFRFFDSFYWKEIYEKLRDIWYLR